MAETQPNMENNDATSRTTRTPLDAFVYHQRRAMKETGKALLGLLPKEFRNHAETAIDESRASWEALFDGMLDTMQGGLEKMRSTAKEEDTGKMKVEVE